MRYDGTAWPNSPYRDMAEATLPTASENFVRSWWENGGQPFKDKWNRLHMRIERIGSSLLVTATDLPT